MSEAASSIAAAFEKLDEPSGEWVKYTPASEDDRPDVAVLVPEFEPLDFPAGHAAAAFLKETALVNHGSTVTHLLVGSGRIEGFVSTCFTEVMLTREQSARLRVPHRDQLPAFCVAWVAKHCDSSVPGLELMAAAYGMALNALDSGGLVAMVVDPHDATVANIWMGDPYYFEESKEKRRSSAPRKLWTPLVDPEV